MTTETHSPRAGAVLASLLTLGILLFAAWLEASNADAYYRAVQEDEFLEWSTFWAFILAAGLFARAAVRERRLQGGFPWFFSGVALFCFVVGMEEISWGQRVLGYRPPVYFLANNFQQELNFHNVVDTSNRKLALKVILAGYGVVFPLIMLWPPVGNPLRRLGLRPPHLGLALTFGAAGLTYQTYPWKFTGEWVEMVAGFGFLFAGYLHCFALRPVETTGKTWLHAATPALATLLLASVTTAAWRHERQIDPAMAQTTTTEVEALLQDFRSGKLTSRCGVHRRLFTYMEKNDQPYLREGRFAALVAQGLPEARAQFLLDPWNSPYWLRHRCDRDTGREVAFVYSFGPNRRRDSSRWEILGDDVGTYIYRSD